MQDPRQLPQRIVALGDVHHAWHLKAPHRRLDHVVHPQRCIAPCLPGDDMRFRCCCRTGRSDLKSRHALNPFEVFLPSFWLMRDLGGNLPASVRFRDAFPAMTRPRFWSRMKKWRKCGVRRGFGRNGNWVRQAKPSPPQVGQREVFRPKQPPHRSSTCRPRMSTPFTTCPDPRQMAQGTRPEPWHL